MRNRGYVDRLYTNLLHAVAEEGEVPCQNFPDAYFPEDIDRGSVVAKNAARELCQLCPLRLQCLEYALEAREQYGIWGGFTAKERNEMLRERGTW